MYCKKLLLILCIITPLLNVFNSCKKDALEQPQEESTMLEMIKDASDTSSLNMDTVIEEEIISEPTTNNTTNTSTQNNSNKTVEQTKKVGYCLTYSLFKDKGKFKKGATLQGVRVKFKKPKGSGEFQVKYYDIYGERQTSALSMTTITRTVQRYYDSGQKRMCFRYKKRYTNPSTSALGFMISNLSEGNFGTWQKNWSVNRVTSTDCEKSHANQIFTLSKQL